MSPRQIRVAPAILLGLGLFAITVTAQDRRAYAAGRIEIKDPAELTKAQAEPIFSGPQAGETLPSFRVIGLSGALEGVEFDPAARAGDKLHLLIFGKEARTFGRFLGNLGRQLDTIERNSGRAWEMSFIVVNDDPNDVESKFEAVARSFPASLAAGLSVDGAEGPPAYGLNRNMTATVIVAKGGVVVHSLPYPQDGFYSDPYILGALASVMEVDHDTLRKYIGDTPGDQATAAARQRAGAANMTPEQQAFRAELGQRVQAGEITREEAGRLYREKFAGGGQARGEMERARVRPAATRQGTDWDVRYEQFLKDNPQVKARVEAGQITREQVIAGLRAREEEARGARPIDEEYEQLLKDNPRLAERLKTGVDMGRLTKEQAVERMRAGQERAREEPRPIPQGEALAELAAGKITVEEASAMMDRIREQQINQRMRAQRDTLTAKLVELMREGKIERADIQTIVEAAFPSRRR